MKHVDDYVNEPDADSIAKEFLEHARRYVTNQNKAWLAANRPWVMWRGRRYRCVGASRLGDVWLKTEPNVMNPGAFYDYRVDVAELSGWERP